MNGGSNGHGPKAEGDAGREVSTLKQQVAGLDEKLKELLKRKPFRPPRSKHAPMSMPPSTSASALRWSQI